VNPSQLLALSHSTSCKGDEQCHWCAAPCDRFVRCDYDPLVLFIDREKTKSTAKRPNNPYICVGCSLYKRQRITVISLTGKMKDRRCLEDYSWLMTEESIRVILPDENYSLYEHLLFPSLKFSLSLLSQDTKSLIQLAVVNDISEIKADTLLSFTIDNRVLQYTIYELEEALKHGSDGKMPGVRALLSLLGPYTPKVTAAVANSPITSSDDKRKPGRPKNDSNPTKKTVTVKSA
jgi:hypothetical protein